MLDTIQLAIDAGMRERAREQIARSREAAIQKGIPVTNRTRSATGATPRRGATWSIPRRPRSCARSSSGVRLALALRSLATFSRRTASARRWVRRHGAACRRCADPQPHLPRRGALRPVRESERARADRRSRDVDGCPVPGNAPKPGRRPSTYLLRASCAASRCGHAMTGTRSSRGKRLYRCRRRHAGASAQRPRASTRTRSRSASWLSCATA